MAKKRGLGRGLDALLSVPPAQAPADNDAEQLRRLPVDLIQRGRYQPRTVIDKAPLEELADSIRAQGVVQPIVVRPLAGGDRFEIIAGERRWRACQLAGLHEIPAIVRSVNDEGAMSMALIENIQREDLNPLEEARGLYRLINEFEMTHQLIAEAIGRSRSTVSNLLRLLELEQGVQELLGSGALEMGHARALLGLPRERQKAHADLVVSRKLSVRETEQLVRQALSGSVKKQPNVGRDPNIARLEQDLGEKLGAAVSVRHGTSGKGTVTINYNSLDELDGILEHIK